MLTHQSEAITLSSFNYGDYDRIATFFTEQYGVIKLFVKGGNRQKMRPFCEPFTLLDLTYKPQKNDLHSFKEAKIIEAYLKLRDSYDALDVGMKLLNITAKSQFIEAPAPKIFLLLKHYLKKTAEFKNPHVLYQSYLLKILLFEGSWTIQTKCSKCKTLLENFYYSNNGYFCDTCALSKILSFNIDDMQTLSALIHERSFTALDQIEISQNLSEKIDQLFNLMYSH